MPTTQKNLHRGSQELRAMRNFLEVRGYRYDRCNGSHETWVKDGCRPVTINYKLRPEVAKRLKANVVLATALKGRE